jgi:hypothetical protein
MIGWPSAFFWPVSTLTSFVTQSEFCLTEIAVCTACGTSMSTSNVFCAAFSFGTRST